MPPIRTFFVVSTQTGEDELLCFHDQVSRVLAREGHAMIVLIDGAEIHLHQFTVREAIQKLFVPVCGSPGADGSTVDVRNLN